MDAKKPDYGLGILERLGIEPSDNNQRLRGQKGETISIRPAPWASRLGSPPVTCIEVQSTLPLVVGGKPSYATIRESYVVGSPDQFNNDGFPIFKVTLDSPTNVFYHSNCYTEMSGWENITRNEQAMVKLEQVLAGATEIEG